jgi:hypothetical protein
MRRIRAHLSRVLALALALCVLGTPVAGAATSPPARSRGTAPQTFPIPASARVHGTSTAPASTVPVTPAGAAATSGASATRATTTPAAGTGVTPATGVAPATGTGTAPATGAPSGATPGTATPTHPGTAALPAGARRTAGSSTRLSAGAIVAAALAALLILVCLAWGAARWFAYEPRWSVSLRHSLAEAGWRLSASWDELSDWARIGR